MIGKWYVIAGASYGHPVAQLKSIVHDGVGGWFVFGWTMKCVYARLDSVSLAADEYQDTVNYCAE